MHDGERKTSIMGIFPYVNGNSAMDEDKLVIDSKSPTVKVSHAQRTRLKKIEIKLEEDASQNMRASDVVEVLLDLYDALEAKGQAPRPKITPTEQIYCDALVKELRKNNKHVRSMIDALLGQK